MRYGRDMTSSDPWLTQAEQHAWRNWLAISARLPSALHRQLQRDSALSLQDFEVLVHLSETGEHRARIADLAQAMQWERSRLSHHIKRMATRGLVVREECVEDGRGAYVVLTDEGLKAIEHAAPGHAQTVKELVFSALTEAELRGLTSVVDKVMANLDASVLAPSATSRTTQQKDMA